MVIYGCRSIGGAELPQCAGHGTKPIKPSSLDIPRAATKAWTAVMSQIMTATGDFPDII